MRSRSLTLFIATLAVAGLALGGCATKKTEAEGGTDASVAVGMKAPEEVGGNVVTLDLTAKDVEIVKADGDTSGKTGHFHVFIDREPVAAGAVIPKEAGIVHSVDAATKITGLSAGEHTFAVVLGNGAHQRIGDAQAKATVKVNGPSLDASAPATAAAGAPVPVAIKLAGATVAAVDGDTSGKTGHFHLFIDRDPILTGPIPKEAGIVHTTEVSYAVEGLAAGEHTIWIVFGNGVHESLKDPVMDKVTVTVG